MERDKTEELARRLTRCPRCSSDRVRSGGVAINTHNPHFLHHQIAYRAWECLRCGLNFRVSPETHFKCITCKSLVMIGKCPTCNDRGWIRI